MEVVITSLGVFVRVILYGRGLYNNFFLGGDDKKVLGSLYVM